MNGRAFKQPRRGGNNGRGGHFDGSGNTGNGWQNQQSPPMNVPAMSLPGFPTMPPMPSPPQGIPPLDPNNPMAAILAMQAMGFPVPNMPGFPQDTAATGQSRSPAGGLPPMAKRKQMCRDYNQKGFCARGNTCLFEHGNDSIYVPSPTPMDGMYCPRSYLLLCAYFYNRIRSIKFISDAWDRRICRLQRGWLSFVKISKLPWRRQRKRPGSGRSRWHSRCFQPGRSTSRVLIRPAKL